MKTAWTIAKTAALKFGGSAKQYLSGALKQAWGIAMETMETIETIETIETMETMEQKIIRFGGKFWEKENIKRVYLNKSVIESALGFGGFSAFEESKIKKAKIWYDCISETFHSDCGTVRSNFNQRGVKCLK